MTGFYVQEGKNLDYTNSTSSPIPAGTLVILGAIAAIAATTIAPGETGAVATEGVFSFEKDNAAVTEGAKVYYSAANDNVTATAADNTYIGIAIAAAEASDTAVSVKLNT